MSEVTAIVLAAGKGLRFKSKKDKLLVKLKHKPIIIWCLNTLSRHTYIKDIILVVNTQNLKEMVKEIKQYRISKLKGVVLGGQRRQDSVMRGLKAISPKTDLVLIHDGVRPFIQRADVSSLIQQAKRYGAAILGVPVKATIKKIKNGFVERTLDRNNLWEIQTPQVFRKNLILKAYEKFGKINTTDDASLVERLGVKVSVVRGSYNNIKLTTPEDLIWAKAILK